MLDRIARKLKRRWACLALAALLVVDLVVVDPLPVIDEALLAVLTAGCLRRHAKAEAGDPGDG